MIEINPQVQLDDYRIVCRFGWQAPLAKVSFRRYNYLHTKFCRTHYTAEELEKLGEGLTGNEIKPKPQPKYYHLCVMYGEVHSPVEKEEADRNNYLEAKINSLFFYEQSADCFDLDKKYIW